MSLELEIKLYGIMSEMLDSMVDGIPEDRFQERTGQCNPPSWILGHLAVVNEFGVATLGGQPELLEQYLASFGPGSPSVGDHPDKATLQQMFSKSKGRFLEALSNASEETLQANRDSNSVLVDRFPLVIDILGHLLTSHLSLHIGQLSAWRRERDMDSILKIPSN